MMNELWKMTAHQVKEAHFTKAIISIGSCEAHGPVSYTHLTLPTN